MLKQATKILTVLSVFLLASYLIYVTAFASEELHNQPAPAHMSAEFPDLKGTPHTLAQWRGKVVLVNFWATWCAPCREEIPELGDINNKFKSQGAVVVGISLDDIDKIKNFIKQGNKIDYQVLAADMDGLPYSISLGNRSMAVPYSVLLDQEGKIAHAYYGRIKPAQIEQDISNLLNKS